MARTNPLQMAKEVFSSMNRNLNGDGRLHFDWGIVETQQGKSAYEDAINFLSKKLHKNLLREISWLVQRSKRACRKTDQK